MTCKICNVPFTNQNNTLFLCDHKEGMVHAGCCTDLCSWDKKPCEHMTATFVQQPK